MNVKLVYVTEDQRDSELLQYYFNQLQNVELECLKKLDDLENHPYDGVIISHDDNIGKGLDYARELQRLNWKTPIFVLANKGALEDKYAKEIVDEFCTKDDYVNFSICMSAFLRQVKRIKFYKFGCKNV